METVLSWVLCLYVTAHDFMFIGDYVLMLHDVEYTTN